MQFSPRTIWRACSILGFISFAALSSSGVNAAEESCRQAVGKKQAERLVGECLMTETSIHAPCNVRNTCSDIVAVISRGCWTIRDSLLKYPERGIVSKDNKVALTLPKFCGKYLGGGQSPNAH